MEFHDVQKILEKVYIYFRQNGKKYVVAKLQDGRTTYKVIVYRETNNPFGNGALAVEQTAWRNLPRGGPAERKLRSAYDFLRNLAFRALFGPPAAR
jgi:hypothetical protein